MNRWKFSALFLSIMIVMRLIVVATKGLQIEGIWVLISTLAINGPFAIAGYYIFKKRYDYVGYKISTFEKIIFLTMPFLWIVWIGMYFQGMFPGCCSKKEKPKEDILEKLKNNALMQLPGEEKQVTFENTSLPKQKENIKMQLTSSVKNIIGIAYGVVWLIILLFPPQYNVTKNSNTSRIGDFSSTTYKYVTHGDKFVFIGNSQQLDYYLAGFEVITWGIVGIMLYLFIFKK